MADIIDSDDQEQPQLETLSSNEEELASWVVAQTDKWRDYRDQNYLKEWEKYERIFRGQWAAEDKGRESERSKIISPASQQAVETRHAEIMEAIMGQDHFFDITDNLGDKDPTDIEALKEQLHEDFKKDKIKKSIDHIELMAEIYGSGIGEVVVEEKATYTPKTNGNVYGVQEGERVCVYLKPINPKNFLWDPNAETIDEMLGCAVEKYVSMHKIVEGMESGKYKKVDVKSFQDDSKLEPTQETNHYHDGKVRLLRYYGLVPKELLEEEGTETVDLFPEDSEMHDYSGMVEAIVVLANGVLLKAEENPYMMKDRPVVAYQDDSVPGRFIGRGTMEKAYNMQAAIDGQLRAHMDSLALTTAPMVAMDATRLPRGAKYEVKPGKNLLTNGNPNEILMPFHFGVTNGDAPAAAQNFERMLLQATSTVDSAGMPTQTIREGGEGAMSMAMAGIIKKYKRTLTNFQEDFLIPFINKAAWRRMQFDPERYPSRDMTFLPTGALGIIAREYEQSQLINLLKTLGPDTPVMPLIMKGIIGNSSLTNRGELLQALDAMSKPNPQQEQAKMAQMQAEMQKLTEEIKKLQSETLKNTADAKLTATETELAPVIAQAKLIAATTNNLADDPEDKEFNRRIEIADRVLKEKEIQGNHTAVAAQMQMHNDKMIVEREKIAATKQKDQDFKNTLGG